MASRPYSGARPIFSRPSRSNCPGTIHAGFRFNPTHTSSFATIRMNTTQYLLTTQLNCATLSRETRTLIRTISSNPNSRPSASLLFSATSTLPNLEDLQPSHFNPLPHSSEKHRGIPRTIPIWNSSQIHRRSASRPLLLFWSSNKSSTARPRPIAAE